MFLKKTAVLATFPLWIAFTAHADDFDKLDQALPSGVNAASIAPVFDFDTDGCLPSAGISRSGKQNGGLNPTGSLAGGCRWSTFLDKSNTLHRYACVNNGGNRYCGHFYALYFLKDQIAAGVKSGHRHDWEYAAVWTKNGAVTHGSYSAHGKLTTAAASSLDKQNGHLKFVYHKDGALTHAFRFAGSGEQAENPYNTFVTPDIVSWYSVHGDGVSNQDMRNKMNTFNYESGDIPMKDGNFLSNLNNGKPGDYPNFTQASVDSSK
ncbi:NPP1 family protein [Dickeya dianthicola]|uniref:NPP1 family protein n=1 Tax=Dickeya dianthicola TaxID=204039 RepID=UPI0018692F35|nr:NPP1 family protein [Dickeya dianthicola]QOL15323.1 sugar-binding protein [Dickeya dianthicola]